VSLLEKTILIERPEWLTQLNEALLGSLPKLINQKINQKLKG
jgi:hypothetical protein